MIFDMPLPEVTQPVCDVCMSFETLNLFKLDVVRYGYGMLVLGVLIGYFLPKMGVYCWHVLAKRRG